MELKMKTAVHNKTGNIYQVFDTEVIDCTNARDGQLMILYYREGKFFVREKQEFEQKFSFSN